MGRAELPDLGDHRVVVSLPAADVDDLIAACEVLWQEGHRVWSVGLDLVDELPRLRQVFGRRAAVGVHGLTDEAEARAAVDAGASLLASPYCLPEVVRAAGKVPVVLGGLTPQELRNAYQAGASAVQVVPCDAFGTAYARGLPELVAEIPLLATGRLEHYQAELWLSSGALGVWPTGLVGSDLVIDADLGELRAVCQRWRLGDD
ncbi:MAG: bifunctional 4-hydroxy-2-oxoglutarate aldolase/2-dehydro-3-deoxy-phosphogluconate aldolase [Propionicimonas sp.]|nr:bifunctional 4-hydroxy-2-oxoglutarate aldolase/2-dehydro-3-deoxy-phosphogluconate aldolase [Propionicimonas sp.]